MSDNTNPWTGSKGREVGWFMASPLRRAAELIEADVTAVPLLDASMDRVASGGLLHELSQPELALQEAQRLLRPGGRLVVTDFLFKELMWRRMRNKHHPDAHGPFTLEQIRQGG